MKLFVTVPISSIWTWWRERKARKLVAENEAWRERLRQHGIESMAAYTARNREIDEATSPVGWGDKTLDGTGTGLVRGGDPPEQTTWRPRKLK